MGFLSNHRKSLAAVVALLALGTIATAGAAAPPLRQSEPAYLPALRAQACEEARRNFDKVKEDTISYRGEGIRLELEYIDNLLNEIQVEAAGEGAGPLRSVELVRLQIHQRLESNSDIDRDLSGLQGNIESFCIYSHVLPKP